MTGKIGIGQLAAKGLIETIVPDRDEIQGLLASADSHLTTSQQTLKDNPVSSFAQAYDAVYEACCAFMKHRGWWMAGEKSHSIILAFCRLTLEDKYVRILDIFEQAERRRHDDMYDGRFSMDVDKAQEMVRKAKTLVRRLALLA
ncbi:MAG: hypothetical protein ABSG90_07110 [Dehalococcoidia bacterium]|jgi:uncharacterized protein (UPF0332 family)